MKRLITLLLALTLILGLSVPAMAAPSADELASAQLLYNLGLFRGVSTNPDGSVDFALDRSPTRVEAATMLVRLLGRESTATGTTWNTPFTDVPNWAKPYVGYCYNNALTNGLAPNLFGSNQNASAAQFLTFILRSLGYQDGVDFAWNAPWELTDSLGITSGSYTAQSGFLRGDAALVSANALQAVVKGTDTPLLMTLLNAGAITDSNVVIWDYSPVTFQRDLASFLFYPVKDSPATFQSFKLDNITVNGLPCSTLQVNTPADVTAYLASVGQKSGGFGYVEITYDQTAAAAAASQQYTDSTGATHPVFTFSFDYTAVDAMGNTITGTITDSYY